MSPDTRRPTLRVFVTACCVALTASTFASPPADAAPGVTKGALDLLNSLSIVPKPTHGIWGEFGISAKSKKRGCRTVAREVLVRDAIGPTPGGCDTRGLTWKDPLTGRLVKRSFPMTVTTLVPTQEAWISSGQRWDVKTRRAYYNDVSYDPTLIAVARRANDVRAERDPASWLPSKKTPRCAYAVNWVAVKYRWRLSVDPAEKTALIKTLKECDRPRVVVPTRKNVSFIPTPAPTTPTPTPDPGLLLDPRKNSCAEVQEAGLGPYVRDVDPEYAWYRDDDGDGTACGTHESVHLSPSADWQTERYTRSKNPSLLVEVFAQPDPAGSGQLRGHLHARILAGETEVWRHVDEHYTSASKSLQQVFVYPALADGAYVAQVWSSYSGASDESPPAAAITMTFVVDTEAPPAPTYVGSATAGTAISDAPDVRWIHFNYSDYAVATKPAAQGQPVSWYVYDSGPPLQLRVHAIDRAGNTSPAVTRDS